MLSNQPGEGKRSSLHGNWSSRMAFILAVTGSAVGLGNIWKFPYIAGQNGGGAFVLVYLACVIIIGMPVMMSEILIGRRGRRNPVATMGLLGREEGSTDKWKWVGGMGVVGGILILSYYSVIAGWTLAYMVKSVTGVFAGASAEAVGAEFASFTGDWRLVALTHTIFMGLAVFVVARGVERGLEQAVRFMVPALLVLMLVLLGYAISFDVEHVALAVQDRDMSAASREVIRAFTRSPLRSTSEGCRTRLVQLMSEMWISPSTPLRWPVRRRRRVPVWV